MRYVVDVETDHRGARTWTVFFNGESEGVVCLSQDEADGYVRARIEEEDRRLTVSFPSPRSIARRP